MFDEYVYFIKCGTGNRLRYLSYHFAQIQGIVMFHAERDTHGDRPIRQQGQPVPVAADDAAWGTYLRRSWSGGG